MKRLRPPAGSCTFEQRRGARQEAAPKGHRRPRAALAGSPAAASTLLCPGCGGGWSACRAAGRRRPEHLIVLVAAASRQPPARQPANSRRAAPRRPCPQPRSPRAPCGAWLVKRERAAGEGEERARGRSGARQVQYLDGAAVHPRGRRLSLRPRRDLRRSSFERPLPACPSPPSGHTVVRLCTRATLQACAAPRGVSLPNARASPASVPRSPPAAI